jgi:hypothetical protein
MSCGFGTGRQYPVKPLELPYERRLADTPVGGQPVTIRLEVRRFLGRNPDGGAVTFAERVDGLTSRRARRTPQLARCG